MQHLKYIKVYEVILRRMFLALAAIGSEFLAIGCDVGSIATPDRLSAGQAARNQSKRDTADVPKFEAYDFGTVLANGQTLRHEFIATNPTSEPIGLIAGRSFTPCCSAIGPLPRSIPPHGEVKIPVVLTSGRSTGTKRVEFAVQTDSPSRGVLTFALNAMLLSEWEASPIGEGSLSLPVGQSGMLTFRIICRRRGDEGRPSPELIEASKPCSAKFAGEPLETTRDDGLIEVARDVEVAVPANSDPGRHRSELKISWGGGLVEQVPFDWQVIPRIRAVPPGLVVKSSENAIRSVVLAADDRPFRIVDVSGPLIADTFRPSGGVSRVHPIRLDLDLGVCPSIAFGP